MKSIRTEVIIDTNKEKVWEVLMSFEDYSKWNPFIKKISGSGIKGELLDVIIENPGKKPMKFKPQVLANIESKEFRWKGKLYVKGLFDGEHYFKLEDVEGGKTRLIHGENFKGILSGLILKMIKEDTIKGFESMNQALKSKLKRI